MTRSMPLPGPSRPQVSKRRCGRRLAPGVGAGGVAAPCGIVVTFVGSTSKPSHSRFRAASDITTTWSAIAATSTRTDRW